MHAPALRFKQDDGQDFPQWKLAQLKQLAIINPKTKDLPNEFIYIDLESVEKGLLLKEDCIPLEGAPSRAQRLLSQNDILFQMVRPYQKNNLFFDKVGCYVASTGYAQIRTNQVPKFLYYSLHLNNFVTEVMNRSTGTSYPAINSDALSTIKLRYPSSKQEQAKVANFLTAVDEKITQLTQKCERLAQYKKGVMQQIFSQKLRFKDDDGQDFPEWVTLQLCDIATRVTRKNKENNLNVLTISAQLGLINQEEYFNKSVAAKDLTNYYLLHHGDFAYNKSYSKGYPMGAIKCLNRYDKGVVSTLYICFRFNDENTNAFFEHYFEAGLQNAEIEKVAQEGARNHGLLNIGLDDFFNINLTIPSTIEQRKIANFLTTIGNKLTHTQNQLAAAKQYKQGLLQQMFV